MVDRRDDINVKSVRRIEVIAAVGGRRIWSSAVKAQIVAESFEPGALVTVVAKRHDVRPQQVHGWRRDAREGRLALPMDALAFAPIVTTPGPPSTRGPPTPIEVEFAGAFVRVRAGVDIEALSAVFVALRRATC